MLQHDSFSWTSVCPRSSQHIQTTYGPVGGRVFSVRYIIAPRPTDCSERIGSVGSPVGARRTSQSSSSTRLLGAPGVEPRWATSRVWLNAKSPGLGRGEGPRRLWLTLKKKSVSTAHLVWPAVRP